VLLAIAALAFLVHLPAITHYGYFRDELYYLECTRHLAWGYVDQPPVSIAWLWLLRHTLGDSLWAIRITPALIHGAAVYLTGRLALEMGGGRVAQLLAALAALAAPVFLGLTADYSMNAIELLVWTAAFLLLHRALHREAPRDWILLGVVLGLGLLNKISVLWLGTGIAAGLLLTPHRRALLTPGPWLAGAVAAALFAPYLLWNATHGWPTLEFMRNAQQEKMVDVPLGAFLARQALNANPGSALLWVPGLLYGLLAPGGRKGRVFSIVYLTVFAILFLAGRSRASYLAPAYGPLFATGAIGIERLARARARLRWTPAAVAALVVAMGAVALPMALPVLPVRQFIAYSKALGLAPRAEEQLRVAELPQHYADMFGWEEMARAVAEAYQHVPPKDRARCAIYGRNYGEAGAIDFFGPRLGLPHAISGHNSYWFWGPRGWDGSLLLVIGGEGRDHLRSFDYVKQVGAVRSPYAMPYERDLPIWLCRRSKLPVSELWRDLRLFI
jgi:4-amino-4-deoxy-L-arabinose transferase-like glycosyltransferase